jgi:Domain of unknown function (DUF222)
VLAQLEKARKEVARQLSDADPDRVTTADAAKLMELFAEIERLGAAGKVLYAGRAAQGIVWRDEGHRSAASWMAEKTGTALGEAVGMLETSEALQSLPETTDALRRGELSGSQVKVIAQGAVGQRGAERELLQSAASGSFRGLKERAAQLRAAACSAEEESARYLAVRNARYVRHWVDPDGAFRLDAKLTPDAGAKLLGVLETKADARFALARKAQTHESAGAYRADALVALVTGEGLASGTASGTAAARPQVTLVIRVDGRALKRGHAKQGEICHIPGVGPVPVATVRSQLPEAYIKILVTDGEDVTTVVHQGRTVTARVQSALEERDPTCVVPGCSVAHGLQNHHWEVDYIDCKTTSLAGLARVCAWHHSLISYEKWELTGKPGAWEWRPPPGGCSFETGPPQLDTS